MTDTSFEMFVMTLVHRNEENLFNDGPDEQIANGVAALKHFAKTTPLSPVSDTFIDLAGFGQADVHFASEDDQYLLLSEVATALGMTPWTACAWAEQDHGFALADQRRIDEERGDGRLGYDCLRSLVDLQLSFIADDPEAKPDAQGQRWSDYGDWLISRDRLPAFILASPWSKEFMDNTLPHFGYIARKVWGDKLATLPGSDADGNPTGTELFSTDGLTEDEALRRARRGPSGAFSPDS